MSPLARLRRIVRPGSGHRRKGTHTPFPGHTVPLRVLMRPSEAMANDVAYCPAENRERLHAFLSTGGRVCWTCRTVTTDPTQPGGAE
ncbi:MULTISPECIES: hypothetical protein [unclassified Streptomyces]|uniref:hypothetical protein n=1 Tax=unclassified Streptomyces TaxID=2593676 RepID=UPI002E2CBB56|nr:hypothetical protein [Streptomyces sp. NBC_00228]